MSIAQPDLAARIAALSANRWFKGLPADTQAAFARVARLKRYAAGELVAARGTAPEGIAIVLKGAIRSATLAADGREIVFSLVQRGSIWGAVAAIDGAGAVHDTRAQGRTEVLMVPRAAFLAVHDEHPVLWRHFAQLLCYRLRKAYSAVDEFALAPLRQRLARQLCTLAVAGGGERLAFTQSQLAEMLGAARPSVNRELRRLQDEGLVELAYRGVRVAQFDRLRAICETQGLFES